MQKIKCCVPFSHAGLPDTEHIVQNMTETDIRTFFSALTVRTLTLVRIDIFFSRLLIDFTVLALLFGPFGS